MATPPSTMQLSSGSSFHRHSLPTFDADALCLFTDAFGGVLSGGEGQTDVAVLGEGDDDIRLASFDPDTAALESSIGTSSSSGFPRLLQNERRII